MSESEPPDVRQLRDTMAVASESETGRRKSEDVKSPADVTPCHGTKSGDVNDDANENVDARKEVSNDGDKNGAQLAEEKQDGGHARLKQQNSSESKKKRKKRKKKKGGAVGGGGEEEKGGAQKRGSLPKEEINGNVVKKDAAQRGGDGVNSDPGGAGKEKVANEKSENREKSYRNDENEISENGEKSQKKDENEISESGEKSRDNGENKISESTEKSHVGVEKKNSETVEKPLNGDENENCESVEKLQEGVENKNNENSEKSHEICENSHEICENSHEICENSHEICENSHEICEKSLDFGEKSLDFGEKSLDFGKKSREIGDTSHDTCEKSHEIGETSHGIGEKSHEIGGKIPTENLASSDALQEVIDNKSSELTENLQVNEVSVNPEHKNSPNESLSNSEHSMTKDEAQEKDVDTNRVDSLNERVEGENASCENKSDEKPSDSDIKDSSHEPRGDVLVHSKPTDDNETPTGDTRTGASPGTGEELSEAMQGEARAADQLAQRENDAGNLAEGADPRNVDKTGPSDKTCRRDDKQDRVTEESEDTGVEPAEAEDSGEHGVREGVIGEGCAEKEEAMAETDRSDRKDVMDIRPSVDTSGESSNNVDISDKADSVVSCESEKDNTVSRVGEEGKENGAKVKTTPGANSHMTEDQLRKQNSDTLEAMTRLQALAVEQKVQANLAMTSLRTKLRRRDNELKLIKSQNEQQMLSVLSRLLFLEGHMQKEHKEIVEILQDKDDVIRRQKAAIADLTQKNERLLQRLRETHGYAGDNGLTMPENVIVNPTENISIQDHGNKVILRGNKLKNGEKIPGKVRFSAMKERLKRHKSSLELYQSEPLETLVEGGIRYGSQESLVTLNGRPKDFDRKERCRSLMDYPFGLRDVYEHHNESPDSCFGDEFNSPDVSHTDSVSSSTSSLVNIGERNGSGGGVVVGRPGNRPMMSYGFNELSKSRSVPHALPTVSENDTGSTNFKERPLSLPSVELLAKNLAPSSAGDNTSTKGTKTSLPPPSPTNSSPPSESSAFKSFKNVFKRRGSKKKKSGTGIADGQDSNTETLKQHFKKYNLS